MSGRFYILDQNGVVDLYKIKRDKVLKKKCLEEFIEDSTLKIPANGYEIHNFLLLLQTGWETRCLVSGNLNKYTRVVIYVRDPQWNYIDYAGCLIACKLAFERAELDNLLSWFSTLGGAFSSLGDDFENCAQIAGQISVKQLKIALRLGDPYTIARCKLYYSISLIQRGHLRAAKYLIREQYAFATNASHPDDRLVRMCLGIWAKLQYTHSQRHNGQQERIRRDLPTISI
ncbi:uncharacterized protein F58A4.6 [Lutzomyia longipalpis]|uniref:Uncharacterized protein n=1 Tax=Lutzomyia longipalpis TaxID=7200 RepID=A0A1B0CRP1_LUTLO|nr:uncharacterized protein F58A4.6 [Lutzomyia longipalpis]